MFSSPRRISKISRQLTIDFSIVSPHRYQKPKTKWGALVFAKFGDEKSLETGKCRGASSLPTSLLAFWASFGENCFLPDHSPS
jgi:hypothetical protein